MTVDPLFLRAVETYLDDRAGGSTPRYLEDALAQTTGVRQRPWWSSPERWLPMDITFQRVVPATPGWRVLATAVALVALLVIILGIGGGTHPPRPFVGLATNGPIAFIDGSTLKLADPDGTNVRPFITGLAPGTGSLAWSPDGTRLSYRIPGSDGSIRVVRADSTGEVVIQAPLRDIVPGDVAWSWDATRIAFLMDVDDAPRIAVARADGSESHLLFAGRGSDTDPVALGWSPDGSLLSYVADDPGGGGRSLYLVQPDGSGLRRVPVERIDPGMGPVGWAPAIDQKRIAFVVGDNSVAPSVVRVYDATTQHSTFVGNGFWPTWSPDGSQLAWWNDGPAVIAIDAALAGDHRPVWLQPDPTEPGAQYCQDGPSVSGRAICAPARWSPDGRWVAGPDVLFHQLVVISATDRTMPAVVIPLDEETDVGLPIAWRAIWDG